MITSGLTVGLASISDGMAANILSDRDGAVHSWESVLVKSDRLPRSSKAQSNADSYRNPGERVANSKAEHDSLGPQDERRPVRHGESIYNAVLQMEINKGSYGTFYCTATMSKLEGFELRLPGTVITTSAHCFDIQDPKTEAVIGRVTNPEAVTFRGSYLDINGDIQKFSMQADSIWINPLYSENNDEDTAVVYTSSMTPAQIKPAYVLVPDYLKSTTLNEAFKREIAAGNAPLVTVAGHSGDKPYLTTHEGATVREVDTDTDTIGSVSDFASGGSGGPVFVFQSKAQPIEVNVDGQPIMIAINKAVYNGKEYGKHSHFDDIVLSSVPFLKSAGTPSDTKCLQMVEIKATSLNMRVGPSTSFNTLAAKDGEETSGIPQNELAVLHGTTKNELGEEWGFVTAKNGRSGYISLNPDYVNVYPKGCLSGVQPKIK